MYEGGRVNKRTKNWQHVSIFHNFVEYCMYHIKFVSFAKHKEENLHLYQFLPQYDIYIHISINK